MPDRFSATAASSPNSPRSWLLSWTIWLAALTACMVVGLIGIEYRYLQSRHDALAVARANDLVAASMDAARAHLALKQWDEAIHLLEDALTTEKATNLDEVRTLLAQAQGGQADALLEAAATAIAQKDTAAARHLLLAYLDHPQAANLERARLLRADLEHATSDEKAAHLLEGLSDDALTLFKQRGLLTDSDGVRTEGAREIFKDTLRRNLVKEEQKREAKREAERLAGERRAAQRAQQIARLRNTPTFRGLADFASHTLAKQRNQEQLSRGRENALAQLFQQLGINDPAEQAKIRARLMDADQAAVAGVVDRKRAEVKRSYRAAPEFKTDDGELFDQLVDTELDNLLKALKAS